MILQPPNFQMDKNWQKDGHFVGRENLSQRFMSRFEIDYFKI